MAVLAYRNALRIQNLINNSLMETERHLFGQTSLDEVLGQTEAREVARILGEVEQKLLPLLERCQRMMNRAVDRLDRTGGGRLPSLSIGVAAQVNVGNGIEIGRASKPWSTRSRLPAVVANASL